MKCGSTLEYLSPGFYIYYVFFVEKDPLLLRQALL